MKTKAKDKPIYAFNVLPRITPPPTLESDSKKMIKISRLIDEISIFENEDDIKFLLDRWNVDILNDISEVTLEIDGYIKKLFIISSDYAIVAYIKASLIDKLK